MNTQVIAGAVEGILIDIQNGLPISKDESIRVKAMFQSIFDFISEEAMTINADANVVEAIQKHVDEIIDDLTDGN